MASHASGGGESNYVNPPFGSIIHQGKKKGPTAWARKAIEENKKGKHVVLVYPIDKWVLMLLAAGAKVENLGDVRWLATEDGSRGKGTGRHIAAFILDGDQDSGEGDERAEFEKWYTRDCDPRFPCAELQLNTVGEYINREARTCWQAWQARAALTAKVKP